MSVNRMSEPRHAIWYLVCLTAITLRRKCSRCCLVKEIHALRGRIPQMAADSCRRFSLGVCLLVLCVGTASPDVRLPSVTGDNMVLQQGVPAPIWGWADPGEKITVAISAQRKDATAGEDGRWAVRLDPMSAGGPFELKVTAGNSIVLNNVLVGEVWIASGQSNMQMRVANALDGPREAAAANYPLIRLFTVPHVVAREPQNDVPGEWLECSPQTVRDFSALQYFFGRKLHQDLGVPVGLIHVSWTGSLCEAWMSKSALESLPEAAPLLAAWGNAVDRRTPQHETARRQFEMSMASWRKAYAAALPGMKPRAPEAASFDPLTNYQQPSGLYNGMIAPLAPFAIRGALWCQGEGNSDRSWQYRKLLPALITDWRNRWGQGNFPFLIVQTSSYREAPDQPGDSEWAEMREAQSMALALDSTAMAVSLDLGDASNAHYARKQEAAYRLALAAEALVYGKEVECRSPAYNRMDIEGNKVRIHFKFTAGGLVAKDGPKLRMFQIAGEDRRFVWAQARIEGDTVLAWSDEVPKPVAVRYAWADNALAANLYNKAGLPAGTFRTDDWPISTEGVLVWPYLEIPE